MDVPTQMHRSDHQKMQKYGTEKKIQRKFRENSRNIQKVPNQWKPSEERLLLHNNTKRRLFW
jgi:hypothetical protein